MTSDIPATMAAVLLTGHGGFEKLVYREDVETPVPGPGEVLIKVAAAGINNTDINTRTAWYSKRVTEGTNLGGAGGFGSAEGSDGGWSGTPLSFPRIQGADCCGDIVAAGDGVEAGRLGERVLVQTILRSPAGDRPFESWTFGSECDGGFAQYAKAPARETHKVDCDWSDPELASVPCAYSTAENLLARSNVTASDRILITGASGGVGSAAVQLAKRRGAEVIAVASRPKAAEVAALGADRVIDRSADPVEALGADSVTVVIDLVAGPAWPKLLEVLSRGGRYATAGAIAGPLGALDVGTRYLKDLSLCGCNCQDVRVFKDLIGYSERGAVRPVVAKTYPLREIVEAQKEFLAKRFTGKLVLIPPA